MQFVRGGRACARWRACAHTEVNHFQQNNVFRQIQQLHADQEPLEVPPQTPPPSTGESPPGYELITSGGKGGGVGESCGDQTVGAVLLGSHSPWVGGEWWGGSEDV